MRRRLALGPWSNEYPPAGEGKAGLHVDTIPWMHERRIAAFLPDGDGETVPSNVEGMPYPIHPLQLTAMGMCVSDSLALEDLAEACEAGGALRVHGGRPAAPPARRHRLAVEPDRHLLRGAAQSAWRTECLSAMGRGPAAAPQGAGAPRNGSAGLIILFLSVEP